MKILFLKKMSILAKIMKKNKMPNLKNMILIILFRPKIKLLANKI